MNINARLFNEIIEKVGSVLTDTTDLLDITKGFYRSLAMNYCPDLLVKTYNATKEEFKTPEKILELSFAAGYFVKFLNTMSSGEEGLKYANISSLLSNCTLTVDSMMVGMLLNGYATKAREDFKIIRSLAVEECLNLTHQKSLTIGDEGILKDMMTVLYAIFLLGCSQKIKYE